MHLQLHEELITEGREQYIRRVLDEWLTEVDFNYTNGIPREAIISIVNDYGCTLDRDEFIEKYNEKATMLQDEEDNGHMCKFAIAGLADSYIYLRSSATLYEVIDKYIASELNDQVKTCGRVLINESAVEDFDAFTTLDDIGLGVEEEEELTFMVR
ncbi:hypothetical protein COEREDRAFT_89240 [Coemansia reversa NRRL 1564]|uniref:Uncharacterized protein n=1 Tax=Coemansia reversa (strain ATCC 12441 / NRRL 1564) TaxID=763665 RepID=A0A2G5B492_COERN|nr:hypothetical protein COEREDRAFT_89240 [Coemansia reversa NRRL 1564]|eukprot:PIA13811.1 hypothetical protein COEREDRAFT_89240 [Coemansia reversa NRRL 1564]